MWIDEPGEISAHATMLNKMTFPCYLIQSERTALIDAGITLLSPLFKETFSGDKSKPDFILLQCGADSIDGDPITHLKYSEKAHAHAAERLAQIADEHCGGKLLALGGGGYNHDNIAKTWTAVVDVLADGEK